MTLKRKTVAASDRNSQEYTIENDTKNLRKTQEIMGRTTYPILDLHWGDMGAKKEAEL